jgi:hypothetical protein
MEKEKGNTVNDSGQCFQKQQKAIDTALNEKIQSESDAKANESQINNKNKRNHSTTTSKKKTGGGKQKSPGD